MRTIAKWLMPFGAGVARSFWVAGKPSVIARVLVGVAETLTLRERRQPKRCTNALFAGGMFARRVADAPCSMSRSVQLFPTQSWLLNG
jgi:hypothetical protein